MAGRGLGAYREQANAAKDRQSAGFARILMLKDGEAVLGRFRGLIYPPTYQYSAKDLSSVAPAVLDGIATPLGVGSYVFFGSTEKMVTALRERYNQVEPYVYQQHYIHGNSKGDAYMTCGESAAPRVDCVACYLKSGGDKRISLRDQAVFSFLPKMRYHKIEYKNGAKTEYPNCTQDAGEHCRYCASGNEAKKVGMKYVTLAPTHASGVVACAERVRLRCAVCSGMGKIRNVGFACSNPDCGEPIENYVAPEEGSGAVTCRECNESNVPDEQLRCMKGCPVPRRAQLFDVDVLVQRTGEKKQTAYQFTEQWPADPFDVEDYKFTVPKYEVLLKPLTTDLQCRRLGLTTNPFTRTAVAPPPATIESYEDSEVGGPDPESSEIPF